MEEEGDVCSGIQGAELLYFLFLCSCPNFLKDLTHLRWPPRS